MTMKVAIAVLLLLAGVLEYSATALAQATGARSTAKPAGVAEEKQPDAKPATGKEEADVEFDHSKGEARIFDLDLNHGQKFLVRILHTCPDAFDYSHEGIVRGFRNQTIAELTDKDIPMVYDQQYGGYVFHITQKADVNAGAVCAGGEMLVSQSFIVSVRQQSWNVAFSGAFTLSGLNDPVYSIRTEDGVKKVQSEPAKEDVKKLGAASFVHLFHDGVQWKGLQPAVGFGLGINSDNRAEYLLGGALRFGDKATLNFGRVWGSISRLPNGVTLDTPITDDNVLNNLGKQTVSRWFFAIGYAFIDTKDKLTKPFAPDTAKPPANAGAGGTGEGLQPATEEESLAALKGMAKNVATYADVAAVKAVLQPAAGAKTICSVNNMPVANKKVELIVSVEGASTEDLAALNKAQGDAGKAIATAAQAALKAKSRSLDVTISKVTFTAACS